MDGAELCARLGYQPNSLRYCGPASAEAVFSDYLSGKGSVAAVRDVVDRFEGLQPYLGVLSRLADKDLLDYSVVEAYWLGNELLDLAERHDAEEVLGLLAGRGLPGSLASRLEQGLPDKPLLHHNWHVLFVGPGNTARTVEPTLETKEHCRVALARVIEVVDDNHLVVLKRPLLFADGQYSYGVEEPFTVAYRKEWLPGVIPGSLVAVHWGFAALLLDSRQSSNLRLFDERVLRLVNDYLVASA